MDGIEERLVALLDELQAALGAASLRVEAWMPVIEAVSITVADGTWVVSDQGETCGYLERGSDDTFETLNRAIVDRVCRARRVEIVVEPEGEGFPDRVVLVRRPAGSDGLVEAATAVSEAIDEIFALHVALPEADQP